MGLSPRPGTFAEAVEVHNFGCDAANLIRPMPHPHRSVLLPLGALTLLAGCGVVQGAAQTPGKLAGMVFPGTQTSMPPPDQVLKDLLGYAEQITLRANVALHEFEERVGTPEAAMQTAHWRLQVLRLSTEHATGPNSFESLLDLSLLVTVAGWMLEDVWIEVWGEAVAPAQRALTDLREEGWRLVQRNSSKKHLEEMAELLRRWREQHPKLTRSSVSELPTFKSLLEQGPAAAGGSSSLLGIVGLDLMAGLEPTAREIERSRELAERALFFVKRAPRLVALEIEVRVLEARRSDEVRQLLADLGRVTTTLESVATTAAGLPVAIGVEREAAVSQLNEVLAQQRTGLLRDLETAQAPLGSVMEKTQAALAAGERMSAELTRTLQALDAFVGRVAGPTSRAGVPTAVPAAEPASPAPPAKPFDVADYGVAAERVGVAANQLASLVTALDERLPEVQRLLDETTARGERAIDHATMRLLVLGLALIMAAAMAVLLVRRIGVRRAGRAHELA